LCFGPAGGGGANAKLRKGFNVVLEETIKSGPTFFHVRRKGRREFHTLDVNRRNNSNHQKSSAKHKRPEDDNDRKQPRQVTSSQPTHDGLEQECQNCSNRYRQKKRLEKRQNSSSDINRKNEDRANHKERDRSDRIPQCLFLPGRRIQVYGSMLTTLQGCNEKACDLSSMDYPKRF
jgi:hypothetical protein